MEIVLQPLVSELLSGLFKILGSSEVRDFARQLVGRVDSEIKELESKLQMVEELLGNAEDRQLRDKRVKDWLDNLQHWAYDAEDLLDEFAYEALRRKRKAEHQASSSRGFSCLPASFCSPSFAVQMGSKIKEINSRLEELRQQRSHERQFQDISGMTPTNVAAPQNREETSSVGPKQGVYGRDKDKAELLKMVKNGVNFQVIAVVGMGGIGKTTIAREVYNHKELEDFKFEKKAWVCVSTTTTFDVLKISKELLQQVSSFDPNNYNLNEVQVKLKEAVSGKQILIVLDDIWKVEYKNWEQLMSPFTAGAPGSMMIVTTRDIHVAQEIRCSHTHRLRLLSDEACKSLFEEHAFGTGAFAVPNQISDSIYERVVERCGGLPLAAKTLGGLLRFKQSDKWENILESKIWSTPNESDHVLPALKLSYYYLPSNLKRCFGYCSIFPQDYEFEEKELALLWIAEGIVQPSEKQLDEASECFHKLCLWSLFQQLSSDSSKYVMHDLVHDLARWAFEGIGFRSEQNIVGPLKNFEKVRHFTYELDRCTKINKFKALEKAKSLGTFLNVRPRWCGFMSAIVISDLLSKLKMLRVLSFEGYQIIYLPDLIGDMIHLRYLNFSYTKIRSLPESTCQLFNLQTLLLKDCFDLMKLPSNMRYLTNLCHLDISGRNSLREMPHGMKKLKNLQVLSNFIVGEDTRSYLEDLRSLSFLRELHISELQNVTNLNHIQEQILSNKSKLKVLILEWRDQVNSQATDVEINLLDKLKPPINLRELTIRGYGGESFPSWLGDLSWLSNLHVFTIEKCPQLIGEVPNYFSSLERFVINDCPKLVVSLSNYPIGCKLEINNYKGTVCNDGSIDFKYLNSGYLANIPMVEDKLKKGSQRVDHLEIVHNEEIIESWQSLKNTNFLSNINSLTISECQNLRSIGRGMLPSSLEGFHINFCQSLTFIDSDALPLSLKWLMIEVCRELKFLKDLSVCSLIESINIFGCKSLKCISLDGPLPETLNTLFVQSCEALETLSSRRNEYLPKALTSIFIYKCEELKSIAESFDNSTCLREIRLIDCKNLESLPSGLHHLPCLEFISIGVCPKLSVREAVPTSLRQLLINECEDNKGMGMRMLTSPKKLEISSLPQLKSISDLTNLTALESLDIISLPLLESISDLNNLNSLKELRISSLPQLKSISDLTNLTSLKWLRIQNLPQLELISNLSGLTSLTELYIEECQKLESIPSLGGLTSLEELLIHDLPQLESFPSFSGLTSLERLKIYDLPQLESIPSLGGLTSLQELTIADLPQLESIQDLSNLTSLEDLQISKCPRIKSIPSLSGLTSLQELKIADLPQLEPIQDLSNLTSLEDLQISKCPRIKSIPSLSGLTSLQELKIADLPQLESIQDLSNLTSLEDLQISKCPRIKSIPSLSGLTSLRNLKIADLPQLESIQDLSNLTSLEDLQISECPKLRSLQTLPSSLQSLQITDCPLLIKRWKSVTGKYSSKIAQIPKVVIDGKFIYNSKEYEVDNWSYFP
ncbi:putative disease resistance protein RGA3 [Mangifera indica]|uniref:putative disease resistance protein RGA3 n=1 Tax=Mangifera indica TaxID=29780 RepID=UPI001CFAA08D|nr:putative disease resistance protein RGA3 [Mangifera indica]XP_044498794.1 putative disease resistance protein RGA3 [Mangifera indica]XP_044498795.1 putative disease resistance protein RGA3 [Mangifera indica]XP_044498796.1 putative disease resistance protein RGA3 [Mangifera indica]XP_044498797.1 putative disease resistance protein RGA3 [Mangifera indica]XP_044498798.1 putative disease resistance protein RGA3 [Mangifera indica]XP_044498799.1 putative disease resistance protein RGA3 [Mangifer